MMILTLLLSLSLSPLSLSSLSLFLSLSLSLYLFLSLYSKMDDLMEYMEEKELSQELQTRILNHYRYKWKKSRSTGLMMWLL